ncbi:MAG: T9SS type A sorting domain-containing protein [Saprospiraceae bacterium]
MKNSHYLPFLLALAFWAQQAAPQDTLHTEWAITATSPVANGNADAWAIGTDPTGNIFWGVNLDMPGLFILMDATLWKLDADANIIWQTTAATGPFAQQSYNLKVMDSLVFAAGRTCRGLALDSCDVLLFTVDAATGTTDWAFEWDGGFGYEETDGIALQSGSIIISGWSDGDGTEVDGLLMKLNATGDVLWQTTFGSGTARDDHFDGHAVVDDSMIYVCGLWDGSPLVGWDGRALLAKFNKTDGTFVDSVLFGRQDTWLNAENALGMTTDGTFLYVTGYTTPAPNDWDIFVAKYDKDLHQLWHTSWGGPMIESARAITVAPDGAIYIGGNTNSFGNGNVDIALLKLAPDGALQWYKTWGEGGDDQTLDIHLRQNALYLTGKTNSSHPSGKWEAVLLKVAVDSVNATGDIPAALSRVKVQPNPARNQARLTFVNVSHIPHTLLLFDAFGREVETVKEIVNSEVTVQKGSKHAGVYFFQLRNRKKIVATGKVVFE